MSGMKTSGNFSINREELLKLVVEEVERSLGESPEQSAADLPKIPLGVSGRHVHISENTFHLLFGEEDFMADRKLYQPGEFASMHTVTLVGPKKRALEKVRILGPMRNYDQAELSLSDAIYLGVDAPVVNSGDLSTATALTMIGPRGSVYLEHCAIIASRHIHMTNRDAEIFNVKEGDYCKVRIGGSKPTTFEKVLVRINDSWKLQIHLDTDDSNAADVRGPAFVEFLGKM